MNTNEVNIELSTTQVEAVLLNLSASLVRKGLTDPRSALGIATAFSRSLEFLMTDDEEWKHRLLGILGDTWVGQEKLKPAPVLEYLVETEFVTVLKDESGVTFRTGKTLIDIILADKRSIAPVLASEGISKLVADGTAITNRIRGYGRTDYSELNIKTINILEEVEFMRSEWALKVLRGIYKKANKEQKDRLDTEMFVLKGTGKLIRGMAYNCEFFFDDRGRMGQVNCEGPNGSSSDIARGCMDLHGVGQYNPKTALKLLTDEIEDMGKFNDNELELYMSDAVRDPEGFYLKHMEIKGKPLSIVSKPLNFAKVAFLISELRLGNTPYIGIAIGLDAKCSGPQLGACMLADDKMLVACGFTTKEVDDAYKRAIQFCNLNKIEGLTRSAVKKAFMAIFYGAGKDAMRRESTIGTEAYLILYEGLSDELVEIKSQNFHKSIVLSFGRRLNELRKRFLDAGLIKVKDQPTVCKYDKPVKYRMPDGFEVATREKVVINLDGEEFIDKESNPDLTIYCDGLFKSFERPTFKLNNIAYSEYARKGFVNMIQATDAQLARLVILHLHDLGAQHIISIHDCFRVNINEMGLLEEAIQRSYLELFGSVQDEPTKHLKESSDILKAYFKGSEEATSNEYKNTVMPVSQFYGSGRRVLNKVGGVKFTTLVRKLGETKYFSK